jgi:hypothetical protein
MVKVFVLEDMETRIKTFKKEIIGVDLVIATSYDEAISLWRPKTFDVVFLDHDLGGRTSSNCLVEPNVGCRFARDKQKELWSSLVFVHSLNEYGRNEIAEIVNGTAIPFIAINWNNLLTVLNDPQQLRSQIDANLQ